MIKIRDDMILASASVQIPEASKSIGIIYGSVSVSILI